MVPSRPGSPAPLTTLAGRTVECGGSPACTSNDRERDLADYLLLAYQNLQSASAQRHGMVQWTTVNVRAHPWSVTWLTAEQRLRLPGPDHLAVYLVHSQRTVRHWPCGLPGFVERLTLLESDLPNHPVPTTNSSELRYGRSEECDRKQLRIANARHQPQQP